MELFFQPLSARVYVNLPEGIRFWPSVRIRQKLIDVTRTSLCSWHNAIWCHDCRTACKHTEMHGRRIKPTQPSQETFKNLTKLQFFVAHFLCKTVKSTCAISRHVFQGFSKGQSKGQQQISSTWHAANTLLTLHGALEEPRHMHNFTHQLTSTKTWKYSDVIITLW